MNGARIRRRIQPAGRVTRRLRYAARGQALIMAVLIMFLLVGLGGLFVATLNQALVQTARAEERAKLEDIVEAGLQQFTNHLLYSPDGADARPDPGPDPNNPGWMAYGGGFYRVTLTYGPTARADISATNPMGASPLQRLLKVDVEARFTLDNPPDPKLRDALDPLDPAKKDDQSTFELYNKGFKDARRFLTRRLTAFVPIGLPDYLMWITNADGRTEPAVLAPDVELGSIETVKDNPNTLSDIQLSDPTNASSAIVNYMHIIEGPVRCDGNLAIGSHARIDLTTAQAFVTNFAVQRSDLLEVVGALTDYNADASTTVTRVVLNAPDVTLNAASSAVAVDPVKYGAVADKLRFIQTRENNPLIRPLKAPLIDRRDPVTNAHRYRTLTAESALWDYTANASASASAFTSQMLGWGNGLYLDEKYANVQYGGDLQTLRDEWLNPKDPSYQGLTWIDGVYHPENAGAIEITLHDWEYNSTAAVATRLPYLELRRFDGGQFFNKANQPVGERITLPYPRNGVIFAEGNLIVKGNLPASLAFDDTDGDGNYEPMVDAGGVQRPGGWYHDAVTGFDSVRPYVSAANRRYDLTVVSGGTVYIEGNLIGPATRRATFQNGVAQAEIKSGSPFDSKVALLARDNVCLNPTKLFASASREPEMVGSEQLWRVRAGDPLDFTFSTAGAWGNRTRLLLRHAGAAVVGQPDYGVMRMLVNGEQFLFAPGVPSFPERLCFGDPGTIDLRCPWWTNPVQWGGGLYANDPLEQQTWDVGSSVRYASATPPLEGNGALNTVRFEWLEGSDYLLAASKTMPTLLVTGIDLRVDALVYAQRGNWFIIPGVYYNDPDDPITDLQWPFPKPGEPLDVRLIVHGAIVENRPAPPEAQEEWIRHWRGSNISYFTNAAGEPALLDPAAVKWDATQWVWFDDNAVATSRLERRMGIEYHYDATLLRPACFQEDANGRYFSPRLPKLPVCPSVFSIGVMQNT
jgi:hypothetical protein